MSSDQRQGARCELPWVHEGRTRMGGSCDPRGRGAGVALSSGLGVRESPGSTRMVLPPSPGVSHMSLPPSFPHCLDCLVNLGTLKLCSKHGFSSCCQVASAAPAFCPLRLRSAEEWMSLGGVGGRRGNTCACPSPAPWRWGPRVRGVRRLGDRTGRGGV